MKRQMNKFNYINTDAESVSPYNRSQILQYVKNT